MPRTRTVALVTTVFLTASLPSAAASMTSSLDAVSDVTRDLRSAVSDWLGLDRDTSEAPPTDDATAGETDLPGSQGPGSMPTGAIDLPPPSEDTPSPENRTADPPENRSTPEPEPSPPEDPPSQEDQADGSTAEDGSTGGSDPAARADLDLGMHVNGVRRLGQSPGTPNASEIAYGQVWVGDWNLEYGWSNVGDQVEWLVAHDVTPVIQVFYWGNDIDKACFQGGCAGKTPAEWTRLVDELGAQLEQRAGGEEVIVVLEPEFNKGNVATYEPLDAALAEKADQIHKGYPGARVALGFGGWAPQHWDTWDRAMDASDMASLQLMRGSTQDSQATYADGADALVRHAESMQELFGKPVIVSDVALATYPGQPYLDLQAEVLGEIVNRADELEAAGVEGVLYRALLDDPSAPTYEYYGDAEVTWGLKHANGTAKPAYDVWVEGLQAHG